MANQHTARKQAEAEAAAAAAAANPADDGPELGDDTTPPTPTEVPSVTLTQAELEDMLAHAATAAAEQATRAAQRHQAQQGPVTVNSYAPSAELLAVDSQAVAPDEPTYEPGETDDEGVAYAATIVVSAPNGTTSEVTPKVFRTLLAARGYKAHPLDAQQHLGNEPRRTRRDRRAANVDGSDPELATAPRRRRRAAAAAE